MIDESAAGGSLAGAAGHETSDVSIRGIALFAAGLAIVLVGAHVFLAWLLHVLETQTARQDPERSPLAELRSRPPEPQLESSPTQDLDEMRNREDELLNPPHAVDEGTGDIRIPIARAMVLVARRGLPKWPEAKPSASE